MSQHHLTPELFRRARAGEVPMRLFLNRLLVHLSEQCPQCSRKLSELGADSGLVEALQELDCDRAEGPPPGPHLSAVETARRALDRTQARLQGEATETDLLDILKLPPAEHLSWLDETQGASLGLWERLIDLCLGCELRSGDGGEEVAELALKVADRLDPGVYGRGLPQDCKALTWVVLAAARLLRWDFEAADEALERAQMAAEVGTGDPCVAGEIFTGRAQLFRARGRLPESLLCLSRAAELFREAGELQLEGETLLRQGLTFHQLGWNRRARAAIGSGLMLFDARRDPQLAEDAGEALLELLDEDEGEEPAGGGPHGPN